MMIPRYVYFIQCGEDGPIKIGSTRSAPHARMSAFQLGCPYRLRLLGAVHGDKKEEKRIHALFEHRWVRGEWFEAAGDLLEFVSGILAAEGIADLGLEPTPLAKMRHSREFHSRDFAAVQINERASA